MALVYKFDFYLELHESVKGDAFSFPEPYNFCEDLGYDDCETFTTADEELGSKYWLVNKPVEGIDRLYQKLLSQSSEQFSEYGSFVSDLTDFDPSPIIKLYMQDPRVIRVVADLKKQYGKDCFTPKFGLIRYWQ